MMMYRHIWARLIIEKKISYEWFKNNDTSNIWKFISIIIEFVNAKNFSPMTYCIVFTYLPVASKALISWLELCWSKEIGESVHLFLKVTKYQFWPWNFLAYLLAAFLSRPLSWCRLSFTAFLPWKKLVEEKINTPLVIWRLLRNAISHYENGEPLKEIRRRIF